MTTPETLFNIPKWLTIKDVARYLGIKPRTLVQYRSDSKQGRRFSGNPFPEPMDWTGQSPVWAAAQLAEIDSWVARRPGQGIGGGRPLE